MGTETITLRTGKDEPYFKALENMTEDGYFNGNFSEAVRQCISSYTEGSDFPEEEFSIYVKAQTNSETREEREQILDELFFERALSEMLEQKDYDGLKELAEVYINY